jgi:anti-anti-sigma factor
MNFECTVDRKADVVVVTPAGDIDLDTAPRLRQTLQDVIGSADVQRIDVDMRNVTFLDSTGIGIFVAAHKAAAEKGASLALRQPGPMVRMVLELTNLLPMLVADADRHSR